MVVKLKGLAREDQMGYRLQLNFDILVRSLVLRTNAKPLNLIFLCDAASIPLIEKTFAEEQPPFELYNKVRSIRQLDEPLLTENLRDDFLHAVNIEQVRCYTFDGQV